MTDSTDVVVLNYEDLVNGVDLGDLIEKAFGSSDESLGILTVRGIPGFEEARTELLPLAAKLASLPAETLLELEQPSSHYSFGWSHGKEKLQGRPDAAKGSFYANPERDELDNENENGDGGAADGDFSAAEREAYAEFLQPNLWPARALPELAPRFTRLGRLICAVGRLLARQCDEFVERRLPGFEPGTLTRALSSRVGTKARLLHYFPKSQETQEEDATNVSSWCGWHNDHGLLTGLTSALYLGVGEDEGQVRAGSLDARAGLYIRSRGGRVCCVRVKAGECAFQLGEAARVLSGGLLRATAHCVRGGARADESRETLAVFLQPCPRLPLNPPASALESLLTQMAGDKEPEGVPVLADRWKPNMTFAEFAKATVAAYY